MEYRLIPYTVAQHPFINLQTALQPCNMEYSGLLSESSWLTPLSGPISRHYVLASESPLHSEDDRDSVLSIQAKETDYVHDTSDTNSDQSDGDSWSEFELATEPEEEEAPVYTTSEETDNEIISTRVISVEVVDEGDLEFADSEESQSDADSDMEPADYWRCAQCRNTNNNPLYRYCEKCFKVRKNFFPPRPKRKVNKREQIKDILEKSIKTMNSVDTTNSPFNESATTVKPTKENACTNEKSDFNVIGDRLKRKLVSEAGSLERAVKRKKTDILDMSSSNSDSDSEANIKSNDKVTPLTKMISDPSLTIQSVDSIREDRKIVSDAESMCELNSKPLTKKTILNSLKDKLVNSDESGLCIVCCSEPKSGVFVHGRIAHICCCYKCAVKVWAKAKRCPVCNCKVSNVLKVM